MAKLTSNGTPGSAEAANLDENPHTATEESGAPNPHLSLSVSGEINNTTSDKNSEKGAEESGAPNPHSRLPSHDEADMRPASQPGSKICRREICRRRETGYRAPVPGSPLRPRYSSRTYTLGRSAPSAPAGSRAYTLRRPLVRRLRPMDKRWVNGRRRADNRFSPSRNFAGGRKTLPTPETQWRRHATRIPFFASVCSQAASALFCFGSRKNFFGGKNGKLRRPVRRGLRRVDDRRSDRRRGIPRYPKLGDG